MLSQTPTAISSRRHRAKLRALTPAKPPGRKPDYAKHARIVEAYGIAKAKGEWALDRLASREGYASRDSLAKGYRRAVKALGEVPRLAAVRCDDPRPATSNLQET